MTCVIYEAQQFGMTVYIVVINGVENTFLSENMARTFLAKQLAK